MSEGVILLGATSGMARALSQRMCQRGCRLVLAGRDGDELNRIASDLRVRYQSQVHAEQFDALSFDDHEQFVEQCFAKLDNQVTGVVLCHGYMSEQSRTESDFSEAQRTIDVNFTSAVSLLHHAAARLESQGNGYVAAISSVAGDRGRQSNYTYGAAKAGLSTFLQGLRNRLRPAGVHVLTVKPGFVATAMTEGLLDPKSPMVASADQVARDIDRAIRKRKNVLYTPWFWSPIMTIIRSIPEPVFKRLKL